MGLGFMLQLVHILRAPVNVFIYGVLLSGELGSRVSRNCKLVATTRPLARSPWSMVTPSSWV